MFAPSVANAITSAFVDILALRLCHESPTCDGSPPALAFARLDRMTDHYRSGRSTFRSVRSLEVMVVVASHLVSDSELFIRRVLESRGRCVLFDERHTSRKSTWTISIRKRMRFVPLLVLLEAPSPRRDRLSIRLLQRRSNWDSMVTSESLNLGTIPRTISRRTC